MQLDRHRMVRLDPAAWRALIGARPDLAAIPAVADWATRGRPLVARARLCEDAVGSVPLGLPLPPSLGKQRIALAVTPDAVVVVGPPPRLADAMPAAPLAWRETLADLVANDPDVRCFGSLAWQHLTGLPYLSSTSDVDLLWRASTVEEADRLAAMIAPIAAAAPMRIDGEIVAPGGQAIQWLEWAGGASTVLAKDRDGSRLVPRAAVFA